MARGVGFVEGWPAIAWVAGTGAALVLTAGVVWLRARSTPARPESYRVEGTTGSDDLRGLAFALVALGVLTQLLYVGLYVELLRWLLGSPERPRIVFDLFFWVLLVDGTVVGASLYTALKKSG